jgi:hypothetical protein
MKSSANMTRLILTGLHGADLQHSGRADVVIYFYFRFVWGPLPSSDELATHLAARSDKHARGTHWSDFCVRKSSITQAHRDLGLIEFCKQCETIELWFAPHPDDQLHLIWLLDHFSSHPEIVARMRLRVVDFDLLVASPEQLAEEKVFGPGVTTRELKTASLAWRAYRSPTPEPCFNLLSSDLSALPLLRPALFDLLEELPSRVTGLGATEMRLLELIGRGYSQTNSLIHRRQLRRRWIFNELEMRSLIERLAHCPTPAAEGLDDELRTINEKHHGARHEPFRRSRLSLTEFGKAILAHKEDFSRHNPIDRWWGGTRLTNDRLWRWDPVLIAP